MGHILNLCHCLYSDPAPCVLLINATFQLCIYFLSVTLLFSLVMELLAPRSSAGPAKVETASLICCIATLISTIKHLRDSACKLLCQHFQEAISPQRQM